jgi:hypothetical protein
VVLLLLLVVVVMAVVGRIEWAWRSIKAIDVFAVQIFERLKGRF